MSNIDFSALITAENKQETARAQAQERLATLRWTHETGGLTLADGSVMGTSRDAQSQIANAAQAVQAGLITAPMPWKTAQGWVDLSPAAVLDMAAQVQQHVQACFTAERLVSEQINASDMPGALDLDAAFAQALTT